MFVIIKNRKIVGHNSDNVCFNDVKNIDEHLFIYHWRDKNNIGRW